MSNETTEREKADLSEIVNETPHELMFGVIAGLMTGELPAETKVELTLRLIGAHVDKNVKAAHVKMASAIGGMAGATAIEKAVKAGKDVVFRKD